MKNMLTAVHAKIRAGIDFVISLPALAVLWVQKVFVRIIMRFSGK